MKKIFTINNFFKVFTILLIILLFLWIIFCYVALNSSIPYIIIATLLVPLIIFLGNKYLLKNSSSLIKYLLLVLFIFIFTCMTIPIGQMAAYNPPFAQTDDVDKAIAIKNLYPDTYIEYYKQEKGQTYLLFSRDTYSDDSHNKRVIDLAKKTYNDDSIFIYVAPDNIFSSKKKIAKMIKKSYPDSIIGCKVTPNDKKIIADIDIYEGYDTEEIKAVINKIFGNNKIDNEINIHIINQEKGKIFEIFHRRISSLYFDGKYNEALKLIKEVKPQFMDTDYLNYFDKSTKCINNTIELNKKISKNPNNYKYHLEMANIHYAEQLFISLGDACKSNHLSNVELEKVLKLNNKLTCIEKDDIYYKLGNLYKFRNSEKALSYYLKIKGKKRISDKYYQFIKENKNSIIYPQLWNDVYHSIFACQMELKQYEQAYTTLNKRLSINIDDFDETNIKNQIKLEKFELDLFYLHNYKQAKIDAKECSTYLCKIYSKLPQ